ncbi:Diaphanous autoregulatory (DAD) domain [Forsythia ovata]|uniref:Diaphanous autoregulatory (DAD) domain n=1 Tax=Forsythia ovata TaxID=205694 RepID=A0ABD1VL04_9LAMI
MEDWFNAQLEEVEIERDNRSTGKKKGKLTPKRSTTSASNQARETESMLQFMPTPGVDTRHADLNVLSGPEVSRPVTEGLSKRNTQAEAAVIVIEEVDISTMVDELEQLESQEATRNRAERARARRQRNTNALQSVTRSRGNT